MFQEKINEQLHGNYMLKQRTIIGNFCRIRSLRIITERDCRAKLPVSLFHTCSLRMVSHVVELQRLCYLHLLEGLYQVAFYHVVERLNAQSALRVHTGFLDIVLSVFQRR